MAGRHAAHQAPSNNKKKLIIIIICILAAAGLITGGVLLFMNSQKTPDEPQTATTAAATQQTTVAATAAAAQTAAPAEQKSEAATKAQDDGQGAAQGSKTTPTVPDIVIPTQEGVQVTYFNASYIPIGEAKDALTGESVSLREALGTGYTEGTLTFNDDGTFTDNIMTGGEASGRYVVQGETITATYADDRNMDITVTSWSNGAPAQFCVNYGGCIVYFG